MWAPTLLLCFIGNRKKKEKAWAKVSQQVALVDRWLVLLCYWLHFDPKMIKWCDKGISIFYCIYHISCERSIHPILAYPDSSSMKMGRGREGRSGQRPAAGQRSWTPSGKGFWFFWARGCAHHPSHCGRTLERQKGGGPTLVQIEKTVHDSVVGHSPLLAMVIIRVLEGKKNCKLFSYLVSSLWFGLSSHQNTTYDSNSHELCHQYN